MECWQSLWRALATAQLAIQGQASQSSVKRPGLGYFWRHLSSIHSERQGQSGAECVGLPRIQFDGPTETEFSSKVKGLYSNLFDTEG